MLTERGDVLLPDDYRQLVRFLEDVDQWSDRTEFLAAVTRAVRRWFGARAVAVVHSDVFDPDLPKPRVAIDGYSRRHRAAYEAAWKQADPLTGARARLLLDQHGLVTLDDLRPTATTQERQFVNEFLLRDGVSANIGVRVDCAPHGTVLLAVAPGGGREPAHEIALLHALRRHLAPVASRVLANHHAKELPWRLTAREREVTELVAAGLTNQQIARRLVVGVDTVKKHISHVLSHTGSENRTQLAIRWQQRDAH